MLPRILHDNKYINHEPFNNLITETTSNKTYTYICITFQNTVLNKTKHLQNDWIRRMCCILHEITFNEIPAKNRFNT